MAEFTYLNGRECIADLPGKIRDSGKVVSPRGQPTSEILNASIYIVHPEDVLPVGIGRKMSVPFAAVEAIQLVAGKSDYAKTIEINPNMEQFRNENPETGTPFFWGAYGVRVRQQMYFAVTRLQRDPDTRQAVVNIWDGRLDSVSAYAYQVKDLPCTVALQWMIRDDELWAFTTMRSNDVWWGLTYDIFQFTQLQLTIANVLGVDPGPYVHHTKSLHLYHRDLEAIDELDYTGSRRPDDHPRGFAGGDWMEAREQAALILGGVAGEGHRTRLDDPSHLWYWEHLHGKN